MKRLKGTEQEIANLSIARADEAGAEAALNEALATSGEPAADPEVRSARIAYVRARRTREAIEAPLVEKNQRSRRWQATTILFALLGTGMTFSAIQDLAAWRIVTAALAFGLAALASFQANRF